MIDRYQKALMAVFIVAKLISIWAIAHYMISIPDVWRNPESNSFALPLVEFGVYAFLVGMIMVFSVAHWLHTLED
jgi:uncharacterized membrane protein